MDQSQLRSFESRCIQEEPPACQTMCPVHLEVRSFVSLMEQGKIADARRVLDRTMPLSGLLGRLCEGPCLAHCRRAEVDGAVNLPLLERACVMNSAPVKVMALPSTGKNPAVLGSGLSSLVAAYELGRKGHSVSLYHAPGPLGGALRGLDPAKLPVSALEEALEILWSLKTEFIFLPPEEIDQGWLDAAVDKHGAIYAGQDDPFLSGTGFWGGDRCRNPTTRETDRAGLFAGGFHTAPPVPQHTFFMEAAAAGKLAAGSMIRVLQGVNAGTAREKELPYPTRLYTNIEGVPPMPPVSPGQATAPTQAEAAAEAGRCLLCQCMECVKACVFLKEFKAYPKRYAREMYNNLAVVQGRRQANLLINSCAQCGLCGRICPNDADMGDFCLPLRRELVRAGVMPPSAHEFALEDMVFSNAPDLAFFRHAPGKEVSSAVFFPGCQLPATLPHETERLYAHLCRHLPGEAGFLLSCCGAPARWAGQEDLTERCKTALQEQWLAAGEPVFILACASCLLFFRQELTHIPVRGLWEVLADLPLPETALACPEVLALHDPCASRGDAAQQERVRDLLASLGQRYEEPPLSRELTRCCGYGGLAQAANPALGEAFARARAGDTDNAFLAYCAMCRDRLRKVEKPAFHLLSLLFPQNGFSQDPLRTALAPCAGISERQEGRLAFRRHMLHTVWKEPLPLENGEGPDLIMDDEVARKLDERRILRSDIRHVLTHEDSTLFAHEGSGRFLACLRPRQVTFWVEYTALEQGGVRIHDAYCHRMVVPGVPDVSEEDLAKEPFTGCRHKDVTGCGSRRPK